MEERKAPSCFQWRRLQPDPTSSSTSLCQAQHRCDLQRSRASLSTPSSLSYDPLGSPSLMSPLPWSPSASFQVPTTRGGRCPSAGRVVFRCQPRCADHASILEGCPRQQHKPPPARKGPERGKKRVRGAKKHKTRFEDIQQPSRSSEPPSFSQGWYVILIEKAFHESAASRPTLRLFSIIPPR